MSVTSQPTHVRRAAVRRATAAVVVGTTVAAGLLGTTGTAHASGETDHVLIDNGVIDLGLFVDPLTSRFLGPGAQIRWNAKQHDTRTRRPCSGSSP